MLELFFNAQAFLLEPLEHQAIAGLSPLKT